MKLLVIDLSRFLQKFEGARFYILPILGFPYFS